MYKRQQLGSLGLLKAIEGFDPSFGVRFSTYAVPMITGEIRRFLRDDGPLKVSRHLKQQASLLFSLQEQLKEASGREPTLEELSQAAGIPPEEVVLALDACRIPRSIEEPIFEDQPDSSTLGDTLPAQEDDFCIDKLLLKEQLSDVYKRQDSGEGLILRSGWENQFHIIIRIHVSSENYEIFSMMLYKPDMRNSLST